MGEGGGHLGHSLSLHWGNSLLTWQHAVWLWLIFASIYLTVQDFQHNLPKFEDFGKSMIHGVSTALENILNTADGDIKHKGQSGQLVPQNRCPKDESHVYSFSPATIPRRQQVCALSKIPLYKAWGGLKKPASKVSRLFSMRTTTTWMVWGRQNNHLQGEAGVPGR